MSSMAFPRLNFPSYAFRLKTAGSRNKIFDEVRKCWVLLTPEEWVRQHTVRWLVEEKKYASSLLALEKSIEVNGLEKRCDIVAYNTMGKPILIVECKATSVEISQEVFDQTARYNLTLEVDLFLITNGLRHFCCSIDHENKSYNFLPELPSFLAF